MKITDLKKQYNYWINRNNNAEKYFKEHPEEVNQNHINKFNEIANRLSCLRKEIKQELRRELTQKEIFNGF